MVSHGFFLPLEDEVENRARASNLSIKDYLCQKYKIDTEEKDPLSEFAYMTQKYNTNEEIDSITIKRGSRRTYSGREDIVFIGYLIQSFSFFERLDVLLQDIDKEKIRSQIDKLGFEGYELKYYIGGSLAWDGVNEEDIQRRS